MSLRSCYNLRVKTKRSLSYQQQLQNVMHHLIKYHPWLTTHCNNNKFKHKSQRKKIEHIMNLHKSLIESESGLYITSWPIPSPKCTKKWKKLPMHHNLFIYIQMKNYIMNYQKTLSYYNRHVNVMIVTRNKFYQIKSTLKTCR